MNVNILKKSDGFTLVELMTVVGIIGLLVIMGIPAWNNMMPHFRLKTAAREVSNMAHQARMNAISANSYSELVVNYDADGLKWRVLPGTDWNTITEPWKDVDVFDPGTDTSIIGTGSSKVFPFVDSRVRFRPDGTAVMIGKEQTAVYLKNKRKPGEMFRIRVTSSGTIKVQSKATGSGWR